MTSTSPSNVLEPFCIDFLPISQIINGDGILIGISEKEGKEGSIADTEIETIVIPIDQFIETFQEYGILSLKLIEDLTLGV